MAKSIEKCDGMRKDGTCGNGCSDNHNNPCRGASCKDRFSYHTGPVVVPASGTLAESRYRERVSAQYRKVCEKNVEFFRELINFGALLNEVESFIGNDAKRDGSGLRGWLSENCPEVNYFTAQGYKAMAAKAAKMIGGGTQALACLQGREEVVEPGTGETVTVNAEFIEKRDALFEEVDSRRKLEQMWFQFLGSQKGTAGRKPGQQVEYRRKTEAEAALDVVWQMVQPMLKHRAVLFASYQLLSDTKLEEAMATLTEHLDAMKDEAKRRK